MTAAAPWSARDRPVCLVFEDRLWLIGGAGRRDVWWTSDGRNWTRATARAEGAAVTGAVVLDGKLWVSAVEAE
jgi:hypothetical protein